MSYRTPEQPCHGSQVRLHGYDRKVDIEPGTPAVLEFQADTPGVFEVELEEASLKLVELQVE